MLDFINKIGQRRFAKWVTIFTFVTGLISFYIQYGLDYYKTFYPYFGLFLLTIPHWFLALAANKTRDLRLFSIFLSVLIVLVNFILFFIDVNGYLFFVTIAETILTMLFFFFVKLNDPKRKETNLEKSK